MPNPIPIMIRNWKKTVIIVPITSAVVYYSYDYTVTRSVMRGYCSLAAYKGDEYLKPYNAQARHITVILNPVAGKRKTRKLYTKWVEPLFHLAGIRVSLIETEREHQAHELMEIMSNCDGVAIVGGDDTVNEAIDGLLSRKDYHDPDSTTRPFAVGIIPTGEKNTLAKDLYSDIKARNHKELLMTLAMNFIDDIARLPSKSINQEKIDFDSQASRERRRNLAIGLAAVIGAVTLASLAFGSPSS